MSWLSRVNLRLFSTRKFHSSPIKSEKELSEQQGSDYGPDAAGVRLRPYDKRILVFSGKYKRIEDVPDRVSRSTLYKASNVCRMKICNYMICFTILGAFGYVLYGKALARKGEDLSHRTIKWHKEYEKKFEEEKLKGN